MTDYSSSTPQDFTVTDLSGGYVWTHGLVNTGGSGTFSDPFSWQAALSSTGTGQFTLHYWRSGSTNNWGHTSRSDITASVNNGIVTVNYGTPTVPIFTFTETDAFVSSGGGTGTEDTSTGTSTASGTIVDNSTHYTFTVASTAPSSSGVVAYNVLRDDVLYGTITHTNGSTNPMDIYLSDRVSSNWKLTIVSTTGLYQSDTLATFTNIRKGVFCNFW